MRTIKFRAWDKESKKMLPVTQLNIGGSVFVSDSPKHPDRRIESLDFEVMQFTGFLDKNGKEIFEGDIVKKSKYPEDGSNFDVTDEIEFRGGCFILKSRIELLRTQMPNIEVIGNIYQNPELLKCN